MSRKFALIIGNSEYQDTALAQLITPSHDVDDLAGVLRSPDIGEFDEVVTVVNESSTKIRLEIESFFSEKKPDDLLLLYFSGHGVRDDQGDLYLAVKDTWHNRLRALAIPAAFITSEMDRSRSRRQVLILDCCHSGSFAQGMKGGPGSSVNTASVFQGTGFGRVVLTASDSTQYAWEGEQVTGEAENSVFTYYLVEALRTGAADTDADGQITLDELYNYVYEQVVSRTPKQTPGKWSYKQHGEIVIAKNPRPVVSSPAALPIELLQSIEDPRPWVREGVILELDRLLQTGDSDLNPAVYAQLERLAKDDSRRVADAAALCLSAHAQTTGKPIASEIEIHPTSDAAPDQPTKEEQLLSIQKMVQEELTTWEKKRPVEQVHTRVRPGLRSRIMPLAAFIRRQWLTMLLIGLGWAVAWGVQEWIFTRTVVTDSSSLRTPSEASWFTNLILYRALGGALGASIMSLIQKRTGSGKLTRGKISIAVIIWALAWAVGGALQAYLQYDSTHYGYRWDETAFVGAAAAAILGGAGMGVTWLVPLRQWKDLKAVIAISFGWTLAWVTAVMASASWLDRWGFENLSVASQIQNLPAKMHSRYDQILFGQGAYALSVAPIIGVVAGLIGGAVMLWQLNQRMQSTTTNNPLP